MVSKTGIMLSNKNNALIQQLHASCRRPIKRIRLKESHAREKSTQKPFRID